MNQSVCFGAGAVRRLPRLLHRFAARRLLLVTGRASFEASGAADILLRVLEGREILGRFYEFSENPKIEDVIRGIEVFRSAAPDALVAVGGGSVLDMAKLVNCLSQQDGDPVDLTLGRARITRQGVPLIAVPTTSGSGSEATHFAVVYVERAKYSVAAPSLLPDAAVIDPGLTHSLSPALTAVTGLDAFSQAVESFWSVNSTPESKALSRRAVALVLHNLSQAVHAPTAAARRAMSKAAHLAGRAINTTKTTAAHAMSYPLTSHFGIPHGHAVALTLGQWLIYNSEVSDEDVTDRRGARYVHDTVADLLGMMGCTDAVHACKSIEALIESLGLATRLGTLGISRSQAVDVVMPNVNLERAANNPRAMSAAGLRHVVEAVC